MESREPGAVQNETQSTGRGLAAAEHIGQGRVRRCRADFCWECFFGLVLVLVLGTIWMSILRC